MSEGRQITARDLELGEYVEAAFLTASYRLLSAHGLRTATADVQAVQAG